ncbi:alkyl hydroperoxide reductase/ Thiol specific antioxidant/ Mal allergen [Desulfatibacillum aliphaticivorans]|uniref:thioredoxin-dependent peroxiredoxin n=1 Tax=Desulfatibacillum aliphaticivorans TaxID=218208 RepID=B8FF80_DESAL|nr:peroxiredoxin [Desulfatibacillum aliphaticivorans]ACL03897.1 alkyl hydroperoxide reductase/ Thiol specific antioxidant/ Mal allergen [Desulfatibacillum aliphaticivorans]
MADDIIPQAGDKAPDFCLKDGNENEVCLKDFAGKWTVLYFYPRDNTSGCTTEALEFTALLPEFEKNNAAVIGVSKDSTASHKKFTDKHSLGVTLLSDPDKEVLEKYGAWRLKKMYGKESMGVVRSTFLIDPKGKIHTAWGRVGKAAGHAQKVLDVLVKAVG